MSLVTALKVSAARRGARRSRSRQLQQRRSRPRPVSFRDCARYGDRDADERDDERCRPRSGDGLYQGDEGVCQL